MPDMNKKQSIFLFLFTFLGIHASAQLKEKNPKVKLPDIPGYITLKCDFHLHTVFSDGHVWPSLRVDEAERDGLDVISITEHTDYEGYADDVKRDRERGYEIAAKRAEKTHVLVIKGAEISPRVPPYHNNALFLKDLNAIPYDYMKSSKGEFVMKDHIKKEELMAPFIEAKKQGAFVIYNHPSYQWWDKKDKELFTSFHQEFLKSGLLGGVEVVNGRRYNIIAHRMAEKYNLTMFANSDAHQGIHYKDSHRPMTLVFAKEKSEDAVKEALINRRTLVYSGDYLIGRKPEAEAFFKSSLDITTEKIAAKNRPQLKIKILNKTDIPYEVECRSDYIIDARPLGRAVLEPHEVTTLLLDAVWEYPETISLKMKVGNVLVSSEKCLETEVQVNLKEE